MIKHAIISRATLNGLEFRRSTVGHKSSFFYSRVRIAWFYWFLASNMGVFAYQKNSTMERKIVSIFLVVNRYVVCSKIFSSWNNKSLSLIIFDKENFNFLHEGKKCMSPLCGRNENSPCHNTFCFLSWTLNRKRDRERKECVDCKSFKLRKMGKM